MVGVFQCPNLAGKQLSVFRATDPLLLDDPIVVLYGSSLTLTANGTNNSRIQCHVFTPAGFQSYPRLAVSPNSPLYKAVECLPREEQGDEVCRGLAFGLLKYFSELPELAKDIWVRRHSNATAPTGELSLFSASHAACLASRMAQMADPENVLCKIDAALTDQSVSVIDADVILPSTYSSGQNSNAHNSVDNNLQEAETRSSADYDSLINLLGARISLPGYSSCQTEVNSIIAQKTNLFTKTQKEKLRLEMCELVDTEVNYVKRLRELIEMTTLMINSRIGEKSSSSSSQRRKKVDDVFSSCLKTILDVNSHFLEAVQRILDDTENAAIEDIESTSDFEEILHVGLLHHTLVDVTGVKEFAKTLTDWLRKFSEGYACYIGSYSEFSSNFRMLLNDYVITSDGTTRETSDQQLMSLLIEPVQRLPRYNLYIDIIIKQLPANHPAFKDLITAKTIIADACFQGSLGQEQSKLIRLQKLIPTWPSNFNPTCRLMTATDVEVLQPPYDGTEVRHAKSKYCILLLFSGYLVLIKKGSSDLEAARLLATELDDIRLPSNLVQANLDSPKWDLTFVEYFSLHDISCSETNGNTMIKLIPSASSFDKSPLKQFDNVALRTTSVCVFRLCGLYQQKAAQWVAEITKARIEARFTLRNLSALNLELRAYTKHESGLDLFSVITVGSLENNKLNHKNPAPVTILLHPRQPIAHIRPGRNGVEILATIVIEENGFFNLTVEATKERATRDLVTAAELMPVLIKRIGNLLQLRYQVRNTAVAEHLILHNYSILKSLMVEEHLVDRWTDNSRKLRPASPVKVLTNLFAGVSLRETGTVRKPLPSLPVLNHVPSIPQAIRPIKSTSEPNISNAPVRTLSKVVLSDIGFENIPPNHIQMLESTFSSYILALHARKGNVVGKVLANRTFADEKEVQNLYEMLLNNPPNHEFAAQTSVDVLFAAFEKFIKLQWRDTMGPIISNQTLREMRAKAETLNHMEYEDYMSQTISELAPQNQRAIKAIISLLIDLLEGMGNDGDRGALTAAMTEIVVCDEDPHAFISLFDRLVADSDILINQELQSGSVTPTFGSRTPTQDRMGADSTGSKTSSLSRRFGFSSVNRQNSKTGNPATGTSSRLWDKVGRSTDYTFKELLSPSKPGPLDGRAKTIKVVHTTERPKMVHTIKQQRNEVSQIPQSNMPSLEQVDLGSPFSQNILGESLKPIKKHRRSSLSDLHVTKAVNSPITFKTPLPRIPDLAPQLPRPIQASPLTPSLSFATAIGTPSPRRSSSIRQDSPSRKENTPPVLKRYQTLRERPISYHDEDHPLYSKKLPPISSGLSTPEYPKLRRSPSLIPVPRAVLTERKSSGNALSPVKQTPLKPQPPYMTLTVKKPRMQSPQKISEHLQMHQRAITGTHEAVKAELNQLQDEHTTLTCHPVRLERSLEKRNEPPMLSNLNTRLKALESKIPHLIGNLQTQATALEGHVSDLLSITEKKIKVLDVKLRQCNEENVALYERNNEELMRVFEQVREGHVVEELRRKLRESMEEAERWKRECKGVVGREVGRGEGVVRAGERLREVTRVGVGL